MSNVTRPPVGVTLSREGLKKLDEMAALDSRNRSREVEWLINTEWAGRQLGVMTKIGPLVSGPDPGKDQPETASFEDHEVHMKAHLKASDPPKSSPKVKEMKGGDCEA